jgi:uncharacterized lipoprotein YmbA
MILRLTALLFAVAFFAGCASRPASGHFYLLTPDGPAPSGGGMGIGVGPVAIAGYIDRPNLVVARSSHQLDVAPDHRWAGDLSASIARVTAANLGRRFDTGNVLTWPWRGDEDLAYQVVLDIRQLHGTADGQAVIEAGWRAHALPSRRVVASRTFAARELLRADGHAALVAAQSKLLARLADDIAAVLRASPR